VLIKCPECQREVSDTAPSCPGCGYVVRATAAPVVAAPAATPAATSVQEQMLIEQRVANEGPSTAVAYLLWFFLGLVSAHRFYLGRPLTAILQILSYFVLIGFLWWFIDVFLISEMLRENRQAIRNRLAPTAAQAAAENALRHLPSYHDPNASRARTGAAPSATWVDS